MEYFTNHHDPEVTDKTKGNFQVKYDKGIISQFSEIPETPYVPVTLAIEKDKIKESHIPALLTILKPSIKKLLNTHVENIEVTHRKGYYIFNPISEYGTSIYENPNYLSDFFKTLDLERLSGYTLLSDSPIAKYILEDMNLNVKYFLNFAIIPLEDMPSLKLLELQGDIDLKISSLKLKGYFTYSFGIFDLEDQELIRELCLLFSIKIINDKDFSTFILQTDVDFYTTPEEWLRYNLQIVKLGNFPTFTIKNFSTFYDNVYQREHGTVFKDVVLKYIAHMAFAKLSDSHQIIKPYIFSIQVNEDMSITLPLPSYKLVQEYNDIITNLLKVKSKYMIESCENLREAIIKRYIVQNIDPDAYPMVFEKSGNQVLIHRSQLAVNYPSPFNFDQKNIKNAEIDLLIEMREYYKKTKVCHDDLEAVSLEQISKMNLDELLNLIPVTEGDITYCFSENTISKVQVNPLTRRPLSEETILKSKYLEYGWRGLFQVGSLYGLYSDIPTKVNVEVKKGIPSVRRIKSENRELTGNLFIVEIIFSDGTVTPLFEISLPTVGLEKIDLLKDYVDKLWYKGFFLNYWSSAINQYLDLKSFPVLITDKTLLYAKGSIFDGNKAMEYMKYNL